MTFSVRCSSGVSAFPGGSLAAGSRFDAGDASGLPGAPGLDEGLVGGFAGVVAGLSVPFGPAPRTTAKLPDPSVSEAAAIAARKVTADRRRSPRLAAIALAADIKSSPFTDKAGTNRRSRQSRTDSGVRQTGHSAKFLATDDRLATPFRPLKLLGHRTRQVHPVGRTRYWRLALFGVSVITP